MSMSSIVGTAIVVCALVACSDPKRRGIGATCDGAAECTSGLCYEGLCVDPTGDDDHDGLLNGIEIQLGSQPLVADTDDDGIPDPDELGPDFSLIDSDGDGKPDIIESAIADADHDCIVDQLDPHDGVVARGHCPVVATPFVSVGSGGKTVATSRYRATLVIGSPALAAAQTSQHHALIGANPAIIPHPAPEAP